MKLYSGPVSLFTAKVRVALAEKGLAYERVEVGWSLANRYEPHHPAALKDMVIKSMSIPPKPMSAMAMNTGNTLGIMLMSPSQGERNTNIIMTVMAMSAAAKLWR